MEQDHDKDQDQDQEFMEVEMKGPLTDVFIELHVPDFDIAQNFYGKLGFEVVWRRDEPKGYMVMRRGQSVINFYSGTEQVYQQSYFKRFSQTTPRGYAVEIILLSDDVEKYYEEIRHKVDTIVEPLKLQPWGRKDFRIVDPFGFYLRIGERYDWTDKSLES